MKSILVGVVLMVSGCCGVNVPNIDPDRVEKVDSNIYKLYWDSLMIEVKYEKAVKFQNRENIEYKGFNIYGDPVEVDGSEQVFKELINRLDTTWYLEPSYRLPKKRISAAMAAKLHNYIEHLSSGNLDVEERRYIYSLYWEIIQMYYPKEELNVHFWIKKAIKDVRNTSWNYISNHNNLSQ